MDTSNKIRVVERSMKRTDSGGVRDPSDPKHYPPLGGTEGAAVQTASPQRRLSSVTSFKEALLSMPAPDKFQVAPDGSSGSMASLVGTEGLRLAKLDNAVVPAPSSPRIPAERLTPPLVVVGTAEPDLITGPSQQVAARQNIQEDSFAPLSPRKVVSLATHRRRTADEQADRERFYRKVASGNTFAPLAEDAARDESQESSAEVDNNEAFVPDMDANAHKRGRWGRLWGRTVDIVKEHPMATTVAVTAITVGFMLLSRRRR